MLEHLQTKNLELDKGHIQKDHVFNPTLTGGLSNLY